MRVTRLWMVILAVAGCAAWGAADDGQRFATLPLWDDGLSEMSYYDATDTVYSQRRHYVRVHLLNRQWMGADSGVKASPDAPGAVAVFKLNVSEEIPTPNYNYRYLTTVFLRRVDLAPFKLTASSQEWCGATFKHLRWGEDDLEIQSFSYFEEEGEQSWVLPAQAFPFEALFVLARASVAAGVGRRIELLPPMRSTHQVTPTVTEVILTLGDQSRSVRVPAGESIARRVEVAGADIRAWFDVAVDAPYRLLAFSAGGVEARLRYVERRPYWDRASGSGFHEPNEAP